MYLSVDQFRPEANVVILIVELAGSGASDVLPVERAYSASRSRVVLQTILRSYKDHSVKTVRM